MNGNIIIVQKYNTSTSSYETIGAVKSQEIQSGADTIETASSTQNIWREFIAGRRDWSLSLNYLLLTSERMADLLAVGDTYQLKVTDRTGNYYVYGNAIITTCKLSMPIGNIVKGQLNFKGTGALAGKPSS